MADIAVRAGVSRATVSLVLNGKDAAVGISEETRRRVQEAAAELGYRPNQIARAMVTGRNPLLVFLVREPEQEVAARILGGALRAAQAAGYFVKVLPYDGLDSHVIEECVALRPAGVMALYVYGSTLDYLFSEMARFGIAVAVLDSSFPMERGIRVITDDRDGIRQAMTHLVDLGHRRIAFISGSTASGAAALREEGYRAALAEFDLPLPEGYLVHGYWNIEATEGATLTLLNHPEGRPTAICCADDRTALVACRVAWRHGLRVPDDLSVVGFADLGMAVYGNPPLTTVSQPFDRLGACAVRLLLEMPGGPTGDTPVEEILPVHLVVRESTAPPPFP